MRRPCQKIVKLRLVGSWWGNASFTDQTSITNLRLLKFVHQPTLPQHRQSLRFKQKSNPHNYAANSDSDSPCTGAAQCHQRLGTAVQYTARVVSDIL